MKYLITIFAFIVLTSCNNSDDKSVNSHAKNTHKKIPQINLEEKYSIDLTECITSNCMTASDWIKFGKVQSNVNLNAWFDVVKLSDDEGKQLFPLFNVFNNGNTVITADIGLKLHDQNGNVLIEAISENDFEPTKSHKPGYENYLSMGAFPISDKVIKNAKYVSIVFVPISKKDK